MVEKHDNIPDLNSKCVICNRNANLRFYEKHDIFFVYECPLCSGQFVLPMKAADYDLLYKKKGADCLTYEKHTYFLPDKYLSIYKSLAYVKCVLGLIKKYQLKGKLLDIGCSQGAFSKLITELGFEVFAVDQSEEAIQYARKNYDIKNAFNCSFEEIPEDWGNFDVIVSMEVIEHLEDPRSLIKKSYDLLKPGGYFILTTPNNKSFDVRFNKRSPGDYPPHHLSRYCIETVHFLLDDRGFLNMEIFSNPVDRLVFGNVFFQDLMHQLSLDNKKGMPVCNFPHQKKRIRLSSYLVKHQLLLRIFQIAGDTVSFIIGIFYPNSGSNIIAIAQKPF
ncbi:MAG: hypothetical protein A2161_21475 [Candidatus Schekmanbacteria bacterium RBG_13_48_7]|uniref:Methyltransferase type 11 n=1 Tax=Candidatus Schekmanbacteria bacterium RBG_13_48_7 TaxID=1817878 RepID=A0A1F7RQF9_9BACT|nr:MAG: hypothetical protein A2161_21475 [Candidatus Schekmanbacteria bacterium RBG_13_48_7]